MRSTLPREAWVLAAAHQRRSELEAAERLFRHALTAQERTLGPDHPETAVTLNDLAVNAKRQGHHREAEMLFQRALVALDRAVEPDHPGKQACVRNYARLLRALERDDDAAEIESAFAR